MPQQRHEARFGASMTTVFSALVRVAARGRWGSASWFDGSAPSPRPGCQYVTRRGAFTRRGRVIECLRPLALSLYESLSDPPCRVRLRLRWRLEPLQIGSLVLLDARYELNVPAYLNRRHWRARILKHCVHSLGALEAEIGAQLDQGLVGESGQRTGSNTMTVMNTTTVNGRPSFK